MVDVVQKLPYGFETGKTENYVEIKCKACGSMNDIPTWMIESFLEMNCCSCGTELKIEKFRTNSEQILKK